MNNALKDERTYKKGLGADQPTLREPVTQSKSPGTRIVTTPGNNKIERI